MFVRFVSAKHQHIQTSLYIYVAAFLWYIPNTRTHTKHKIFPGERFQQSRASLRMNFEPKTKSSSLSLDCIEVRTHFEISSHLVGGTSYAHSHICTVSSPCEYSHSHISPHIYCIVYIYEHCTIVLTCNHAPEINGNCPATQRVSGGPIRTAYVRCPPGSRSVRSL